MKKVNVLGTEYEIILDAPEGMLPPDSDGAMDHSTKSIMIAKFESDEYSIKDFDVYMKKVLRHEIIHAFLYESGLWSNSENVTSWAQCEEITDWIAIQFPKMLQAFKEADAI